MTVVEFLLAHIEEDEAVANAAIHDGYGAIDWAGESGPTDVHIARHDPARVLAECRAKRAIIEREASQRTYKPGTLPNVETTYSRDGRLIVNTPDGSELLEGPEVDEWLKRHTGPVTDTPTLRILASVYADHPDYREEWER